MCCVDFAYANFMAVYPLMRLFVCAASSSLENLCWVLISALAPHAFRNRNSSKWHIVVRRVNQRKSHPSIAHAVIGTEAHPGTLVLHHNNNISHSLMRGIDHNKLNIPGINVLQHSGHSHNRLWIITVSIAQAVTLTSGLIRISSKNFMPNGWLSGTTQDKILSTTLSIYSVQSLA
jgi:hypothetical protein